MQDKISRDRIISLINKEVVPAIGCTEPMAVALATARATEALGSRPAKITALLSANILKNAMGVGIPGTGMIGLPIAIALGALIGKSEYQLEVIKDLTPESLEEGKKYISEKRINIGLKPGRCDKLYVEGEIYYRTIEEKNGSTRRQIEITAKNMEMLTPRKDKVPGQQP